MSTDAPIQDLVPLPSGAASFDRLLLFSGGRDSTIAAVRMLECGQSPLLLTVIDTACQTVSLTQLRVQELSARWQSRVVWLAQACMPLYRNLMSLPRRSGRSCLDCFYVRLSLAVLTAMKHNIRVIATGFTRYQASWVEQSETSISEARKFLAEYGMELSLPVFDINSKEEAIAILEQHSLSAASYEPRCHCALLGTNSDVCPELIQADCNDFAEICRPFITEVLSNMANCSKEAYK